jgi:hypothetical protein
MKIFFRYKPQATSVHTAVKLSAKANDAFFS